MTPLQKESSNQVNIITIDPRELESTHQDDYGAAKNKKMKLFHPCRICEATSHETSDHPQPPVSIDQQRMRA